MDRVTNTIISLHLGGFGSNAQGSWSIMAVRNKVWNVSLEWPRASVGYELRAFEAKLQRRRQELTQATPDQPVDDEAVYYNVVEFHSVAEQLRQVVAFMQRQFGMTIDGAGLSQPQPPPSPPLPHEQQQPPQVDPADPPQQQDNVDRDTQE
ncbi:hypothetical protein Syun_006874 [Stephania yunnanensis]|uniref:Uncharacterized protein n=1 Tax=Stephania yunnanensis TaxID=152371 RepID=A0AAP0KYV8_9MAGN